MLIHPNMALHLDHLVVCLLVLGVLWVEVHPTNRQSTLLEILVLVLMVNQALVKAIHQTALVTERLRDLGMSRKRS